MPNINKAIKLSTIDKVEDPKATPKTRKEEEEKYRRKKWNWWYLSVVDRNQWIQSNISKYASHYKCHANDHRSSCKQNDQLETAENSMCTAAARSFIQINPANGCNESTNESTYVVCAVAFSCCNRCKILNWMKYTLESNGYRKSIHNILWFFFSALSSQSIHGRRIQQHACNRIRNNFMQICKYVQCTLCGNL